MSKKNTSYDPSLVALQAIFTASMDGRTKGARAVKEYRTKALEDPTAAVRDALACEAAHCQWIEEQIMAYLAQSTDPQELAAWVPVLTGFQKQRAVALSKLERMAGKGESKATSLDDLYED